MRLLFIFAAVLAVSLAEDAESKKEIIEDLEAVETVELMKKSADLQAAASAYNYVPPNQWNQPQNYVPQNTWIPPHQKPVQPTNTYVPPPNPVVPPQHDYVAPHYTYPPPTWSTPHYHYPTTTTPVPVIKNEVYYGDNGSYKYEYQIADGTHVGEEGYFTNPKADDESLVKKGWYSFTGADGKVYTVTYWADHTGFHAYGDHLPTPPPVPPAIQAALDQNAKEEAEKNQSQQHVYPTPHPTYYPTQHPTYYPTQAPTYYPPHPTYYPSYGKK